MNSPKKNIRYLSTLRIKILLREIQRQDFQQLAISLLHNQLSDSWEDTAKLALEIICQSCSRIENLDTIIGLNPEIQILEKEKEGSYLLLKMISREPGFEYLNKKGWIEPKLKEWKDKNMIEYVLNIEQKLKKIMNVEGSSENMDSLILTPHIYGEICQTKKGCDLVLKNGHSEEFLKILEDSKSDKVLKRSVLWTLGQITSSDIGYENMNGDLIVSKVLNFTEKTTSLSQRGLGMCVISEMSKSLLSRKRFEQLGWESHVDNDFTTIISFPKNLEKFLNVRNLSN